MSREYYYKHPKIKKASFLRPAFFIYFIFRGARMSVDFICAGTPRRANGEKKPFCPTRAKRSPFGRGMRPS